MGIAELQEMETLSDISCFQIALELPVDLPMTRLIVTIHSAEGLREADNGFFGGSPDLYRSAQAQREHIQKVGV